MPLATNLSLSISGLPRAPDALWGDGPRAAIEWAATTGYRSIQLDAAMPGLRPRNLDRSARRDVASILRRLGVLLSGLDLWIPPHHFVEPAHLPRAVGAVESAIELAADLRSTAEDRSPVLSLEFPATLDPSIRQQLASAADKHGIPIADHRATDELPRPSEGALGVGIDPASILQAGGDVQRHIARARGGPDSARLSDWNGVRRISPGGPGGRLDLLAYAAALSVAGYRRSVIVDLRDLDDPAVAAAAARERWPAR